MRILLVEDEDSIGTMLTMNLEDEGYDVRRATNGKVAMQLFQTESFDLIILDIMLPELDGVEVCERIRLEDDRIPILFLTAKDSPQDIINGLKKGADDYLTKPFVLEELLLRIRNLLKRVDYENSDIGKIFSFGPNTVNFETFEAHGVNGSIRLTKIEARLLKMLVNHKNEVVSRKQILHSVWGYDVYPSTRTIDNFILSFRKYFEEDSRNPRYFQSIRGVGYRFVE